MDYQSILEQIHQEIQPILTKGKQAQYIPELSGVNPEHFAMSLALLDGRRFNVGDFAQAFSIQSISKLFSLTLALNIQAESLWKRIGREPSGTAFNSLVQLESEQGIPRNPFINSGAIVVADVLLSHYGPSADPVLDLLIQLTQSKSVRFDPDVASSELSHGYRNASLANFIKSFNNLENEPDEVLQAYCRQCAISMNCKELAEAALYLANEGTSPNGNVKVCAPNHNKYLNSLMLTTGTYDAAGDVAYRVGLPCKSGVGGGIVAVMPRQFTLSVWSPGLDIKGNSLVGLKALELFTTYTGISIF